MRAAYLEDIAHKREFYKMDQWSFSDMSKQSAFDFFFEHAGYSWRAATESQFAGRVRGAIDLALAEAIARRDGYSFNWAQDDDCPDRSGIDHDGPPWACQMFDEHGYPVQSLGGIDFGADGWFASEPYARVIQAELAMEQLL